MTECSPVVAVNAPDFRGAGFFQPGSRRGHRRPSAAGRRGPHRRSRARTALAREHRGDGPGQGPERDAGLPRPRRPDRGRPSATAGTSRATSGSSTRTASSRSPAGSRGSRRSAARWSRTAAVEEALNEAIGADEPVFAVTAVADGREGGQARRPAHRRATIASTRRSRTSGNVGLPNLFIPRRDHFVKVDALPMLGTGKLDLRALKRIAAEAIGNSTIVEVPVGGPSQ